MPILFPSNLTLSSELPTTNDRSNVQTFFFKILKIQIFIAIFGFVMKMHYNEYKQALVLLVQWFLRQSYRFWDSIVQFELNFLMCAEQRQSHYCIFDLEYMCNGKITHLKKPASFAVPTLLNSCNYIHKTRVCFRLQFKLHRDIQ